MCIEVKKKGGGKTISLISYFEVTRQGRGITKKRAEDLAVLFAGYPFDPTVEAIDRTRLAEARSEATRPYRKVSFNKNTCSTVSNTQIVRR